MQELPPEAREKLENIYLQEIVSDKEKALSFLTKAISDQKDPTLRLHWQITQIDYYLFELGDLKTARRLADQIEGGSLGIDPAVATLRLVQRGDIERLDGDLEKAQQFYTKAQVEHRRPAAEPPPPGAGKDHPNSKSKFPAADGSKMMAAAKGTQTDWRVRTVQQNAYYSKVKSLLDQQYIPEARKALDDWIIEFPFSKLNGDYALDEARYYSLIGNDARAVRILKAYRKQTEISNELPPAMALEFEMSCCAWRPGCFGRACR